MIAINKLLLYVDLQRGNCLIYSIWNKTPVHKQSDEEYKYLKNTFKNIKARERWTCQNRQGPNDFKEKTTEEGAVLIGLNFKFTIFIYCFIELFMLNTQFILIIKNINNTEPVIVILLSMNRTFFNITLLLFLLLSLAQCGGKCQISNCQGCLTSTQCATCFDGYGKDNGTCTECDDQLCVLCPNNFKQCTECIVGTGLDNSTCTFCQDQNCQECMQNYKVCTLCFENFGLDNGTCTQCTDNNCKICDEPSICTTCVRGYYTDSGSCINCVSNCLKCTDGVSCQKCKSGFKFNQAKKACVSVQRNQNCPDTCSDCISQKKCTSCINGCYLNNQKCKGCPDNCKECNNNNGKLTCTTCYDRYSLKDNVCVKCQDKNCVSCSKSPSFCSGCVSGYQIKNNKCIKITIQNCFQTKNSKCTQCQKGFTPLSSGICFACIQGCQKCSSQTLESCSKCKAGTYLNQNKQCSSCPSICITCQSQYECASCVSGYFLNANLQCTTKCKDKNCKSCPISSRICENCFRGYAVSSGKCVEDFSCNQDNSCQGCPSKYYQMNGFCDKCPDIAENCRKCDADDPTTCLQCQSGNYLSESDNKCKACKSQCSQCDSKTICTECIDGFFMELIDSQPSGQCSACDDKCLTCSGQSTNCFSCIDEYEVGGDKLCRPKKKLKLNVKFDIQFKKYTLHILNIFQALLKLLKCNNRRFLRIVRAFDGSLGLVLENNVDPGADLAAALENANKILQTGASVGGLSVLTSSAVAVDPAVVAQTSNSPMGMIIGIVLGSVGFLILLGVVLAVWQNKAKAQSQLYVKDDQDEPIADSKKNNYDRQNNSTKEMIAHADDI